MPYDIPRAGHSHTGRALCAVVAECCLLPCESSQTGKTATPTTTSPALLQHPAQAPPLQLHTAEAKFDLLVPHYMTRAGQSHTGMPLCAVVAECCLLLWKSPRTGKTQPPQTTCPAHHDAKIASNAPRRDSRRGGRKKHKKN